MSSILTGINDGGECYVSDGIGSVERVSGGCVSGTEGGRNLGWGIIDRIIEKDRELDVEEEIDVDLNVHSKTLTDYTRTACSRKWIKNLSREEVIAMMVEGGRGICNVDSGAGRKGVMFEVGEEGVKRWEVVV